ncbi:2-hydroxyacid dehydrogenase [Colwellia sp. MEBiC06753]
MNTIVTSRQLPLEQVSLNNQEYKLAAFNNDFSIFNDVSVCISTSLDPINANFIEQLPESVKLISNIGVGIDNIDLSAAKAKGITVTNTPIVTEDTADLAFSLILAASRRLTTNEAFLRAGNWGADAPLGAMGHSIQEKTLGIIGLGAIGKAVARRAQGFNLNIIYFDPFRSNPEVEQALNVTYVDSVEALLSQADIVTMHCLLTDDTRHLINQERIALMKPTSVLVNAGRGELVDDEALISALKNQQIFSAALDVFNNEPAFNPAYLDLPNVTLTPHIGSATMECRAKMVQQALANVGAFLQGKDVLNKVV